MQCTRGMVLAPLLVLAAACLQEPTAPVPISQETDHDSMKVAFSILLADERHRLTSTQSPCDERTDPRLQTHCKYFRPQAGTGVVNGTSALNVTGQFSGTTTGGSTRLLFSAWAHGNPIAEYKPIPAAGSLLVPIGAATWDETGVPSAWLFRLDFEGLGQVDAHVRVHAHGTS